MLHLCSATSWQSNLLFKVAKLCANNLQKTHKRPKNSEQVAAAVPLPVSLNESPRLPFNVVRHLINNCSFQRF